ncbi:MAG: ABC transporter substrate-binding protein, partial [Gemmatimonadetes bacterium]|nr:ABC transporter substrate-binding protein [Gemmatimonadota bacterium]
LNFPGVKEFLAKYQEEAKGKGVDPLGHYLPPFAYAYLQILGNAVEATKSLDQGKLADYIRNNTHDTVVGKVKFGRNGEWATSRVLMVQFRDVQPDNLEQFAGPGKRVVL